MGVLKWVDWTVSEPRYFQLQTDHTPIHLALLDEVKLLLGIYTTLTVICFSFAAVLGIAQEVCGGELKTKKL